MTDGNVFEDNCAAGNNHETSYLRNLQWWLFSNPDYEPLWLAILTFPMKAVFFLAVFIVLITPLVVPWIFIGLFVADMLGWVHWAGATPERPLE
jgi:hypothetical protein